MSMAILESTFVGHICLSCMAYCRFSVGSILVWGVKLYMRLENLLQWENPIVCAPATNQQIDKLTMDVMKKKYVNLLGKQSQNFVNWFLQGGLKYLEIKLSGDFPQKKKEKKFKDHWWLQKKKTKQSISRFPGNIWIRTMIVMLASICYLIKQSYQFGLDHD